MGISHLEKQNKTENSLGSSPVWSTDLQSDSISLNVIMFNLSTSIDVVCKDGVVWLGEILAGVQGFALTQRKSVQTQVCPISKSSFIWATWVSEVKDKMSAKEKDDRNINFYS